MFKANLKQAMRCGSVRFGYGLGVERFERFRFSVPAVPLQKGFFPAFQYSLTGKDGSGSGVGSWKAVPAVPVPVSVSGKTVPTVPVSGSGSVPARHPEKQAMRCGDSSP